MLHEFVTRNRDAIIARTRDTLSDRSWPSASTTEAENELPLFLIQLSERLRGADSTAPSSTSAIGHSAARHGRELLALGFNVSQVVHHYGDVGQAIIEVALAQHAPFTTEEFRALSGCIETAIAEAVTEHARLTAQRSSMKETERLGRAAHDLRDCLNTAVLAFETLKRSTTTVDESAETVLRRSLMGLRGIIDSTLSEVRLVVDTQRRERVAVSAFLDEVAAVANLHAEDQNIRFAVEPADSTLAVNADAQLLSSAVMNLLNNAFRYTRAGGQVVLRALNDETRVLIEIEDECGGIPDSTSDRFQPFGDQHGRDRGGLGLGLSIAQQAIKAHGGSIKVRNMPGKGCVFVVEVPLAGKDAAAPGAAPAVVS